MRTDPAHELLPPHRTCTSRGAGLGPTPTISGGGIRGTASCPATSTEVPKCGPSSPPSPAGEMVEKDQDGGCKLTSQEKDLDRIARQVAAGNKQH